MCYNPFHFHSPSVRSDRKSRLHDMAEDVAFEDVSEQANEPTIDEQARADQIASAVLKETEDIMRKSPMSGLLVATLFVSGAKWADDNPAAKFSSKAEWMSAMSKEGEEMQSKAEPSSRKDMMLSIFLFSIFSKGAFWTDENPAPLKQS